MSYSKEQQKLHNEIARLELRKSQQLADIKKQYRLTASSLRPSVLIKKTANELLEGSKVSSTVLKTVVSIVTGFLTKKLVVGKSNNLFKVVMGYIVQLTTTKMVANKMDQEAA